MINGKLSSIFKELVENSMKEMFETFNTNIENSKDIIEVNIGNKTQVFRELLVNIGVKVGRLGTDTSLNNTPFILNYINSEFKNSNEFKNSFLKTFWDGFDINNNKEVLFTFNDLNYSMNIEKINNLLFQKMDEIVKLYKQAFVENKTPWVPLLLMKNSNQDMIITDSRFYNELEQLKEIDPEIIIVFLRKIDPITGYGFINDSKSNPINFEDLINILKKEINQQNFNNFDFNEFKSNFIKSIFENLNQKIGMAEIDSSILSLSYYLKNDTTLNLKEKTFLNNVFNIYKQFDIMEYKNILGTNQELFDTNPQTLAIIDRLLNNNNENKNMVFLGNTQNGKDTIFNFLENTIQNFNKNLNINLNIMNGDNNHSINISNIKISLNLEQNPLNFHTKISNESIKLLNLENKPEMVSRLEKEISIALYSEITFSELIKNNLSSISIKTPIYYKDLQENIENSKKSEILLKNP